jgi:hypothetical protein
MFFAGRCSGPSRRLHALTARSWLWPRMAGAFGGYSATASGRAGINRRPLAGRAPETRGPDLRHPEPTTQGIVRASDSAR